MPPVTSHFLQVLVPLTLLHRGPSLQHMSLWGTHSNHSQTMPNGTDAVCAIPPLVIVSPAISWWVHAVAVSLRKTVEFSLRKFSLIYSVFKTVPFQLDGWHVRITNCFIPTSVHPVGIVTILQALNIAKKNLLFKIYLPEWQNDTEGKTEKEIYRLLGYFPNGCNGQGAGQNKARV